MTTPLLEIRDLEIRFGETEPVVHGVSLSVERAEPVALVGESGSGKSLTALSVMNLLPRGARVSGGSVLLDGDDLSALSPRARRRLRGSRMGMVFQDPLAALNPYRTIGAQILEAVRRHRRHKARTRTLELMEEVGLERPDVLARACPHTLSGGQRQRAMIAMALAGDPDLLIADEPTTALDVSVQAKVMTLFDSLCRQRGMALLLISHDLAVVSSCTNRISVLEKGRVVEQGLTEEVIRSPQHHYTRALLDAVPRVDAEPTVSPLADPQPLLETKALNLTFEGKGRSVSALDDVSLRISAGETLALVGESGSGKTSFSRVVLRLTEPDSGDVALLDPQGGSTDLLALEGRSLRRARRSMAAVFQDPLSSLNPRWTIGRSIAEPLRRFRLARGRKLKDTIARLLTEVELDPAFENRYPHELSGGQRQRVGLARAIAIEPRLIVLDEAVSALDVSVQARVLDLLTRLQEARGLAYLFITHDLGVVRRIAHRVAVLKAGKLVELATNEELFAAPSSAYTQALLAAVPRF